MLNEELVMQKLNKIDVLENKIDVLEEKSEQHGKDIELVKESTARLEKTTENIATAVMELHSDNQVLKEKAQKQDRMEHQMNQIQNTLDKVVGMLETDHQERVFMNSKITELDQDVQTIKLKLSIA
jgi:archaellum component FlaC